MQYIKTNPDLANKFTDFEDIGRSIETGNEADAIAIIKNTDIVTRNFLHLTIKYNPKITYVQELEAMTIGSFVGSAGGILNLWSGITFIAIVELLDLSINILWGWGYKDDRKSNQT